VEIFAGESTMMQIASTALVGESSWMRRTADVLGCSVKTLYNKLTRYAQAAG
jgi:DNA-binding NtrC family response regulator